ncbi:AAA family ATPase [Paenibacillus sp. HJL G12]|uniref:AAA family ATPase n=1 Tax=Paenibacillus dendrobii TaxID=2691084 RepID=A0A7X3LH97_9BACL|nr:AAA family ATPase [Paenibacillus dendrobii]MWV43328.1 AAA family ATPase [Paenibacillus dendrobii]
MLNLKQELSHVIWIGGSPCSGKSTIAEKLSRKYDFYYYSCDLHHEQHIQRCNPAEHPFMQRLKDLSSNEIWNRPVIQQIHEEMEYYQDEFSMIVDDLISLPKHQMIIVEGTAAIPESVAPVLTHPGQAIWIVPAPEFQVLHYSQRSWIQDVLKECDDPGLAFQNWMNRDIGFAHKITQDALDRGLKVITVDGTKSIEDHLEEIEQHLKDWLNF